MFKKLIPLLIIVLILTVATIIKKQSTKEQFDLIQELGAQNILDDKFLGSEVDQIELYLGTKIDSKVTLKKENEQWFITTAYQAPARKNNIDKLLYTLKNMLGEVRNAPKEFFSDFQLQNEEAVHIVLTRTVDKSTILSHILLGKTDGENACFVRLYNNDTIFRVGRNLRQEIGIFSNEKDKAPEHTHWLDKNVLTLNKDDVKEIAITYPDKKIHFVKETKTIEQPEDPETKEKPAPKIEEEWKLKPIEGSFNQSELDSFIDSITNIEAQDVADPNKKEEINIDKPNYKLEITLANDKKYVLHGAFTGGEQDGYCYLETNPNLIYKLDNWTFSNRIFKSGSKYFVLPSLTIDRTQIQNITYHIPQGTFSINRFVFGKEKDEKITWILAEPENKYATQADTLNAVVGRLSVLKADDYTDEVDLGKLGLDTPQYSLTIHLKDNSQHVIKVTKQNGKYYTLFDEERPIVTLSKTDFEKLFPIIDKMFIIESVEEKENNADDEPMIDNDLEESMIDNADDEPMIDNNMEEPMIDNDIEESMIDNDTEPDEENK
jgi:hypothetical protein